MTAGGVGRTTGCKDHQSRPARFSVDNRKVSIGSRPHPAPSAIQRLRVDFSVAESAAFGGMVPSATCSQSRLSSGLPGTNASPLVPPRRALDRLDRSRPPLGSGPEWQSRQRRARIGATSRSKSRASSARARWPKVQFAAIANPSIVKVERRKGHLELFYRKRPGPSHEKRKRAGHASTELGAELKTDRYGSRPFLQRSHPIASKNPRCPRFSSGSSTVRAQASGSRLAGLASDFENRGSGGGKRARR